MYAKRIFIISLTTSLACTMVSPIPSQAVPVSSISAPTDVREEMDWYSDKNAGIMFLYPKRFTPKPRSDANSLFKIGGVVSSGQNGEIELSCHPSDLAADTYGKVLSETLQKQLPDYDPGKLDWVRFGRSLKLNGVTRVAHLKLGETRICQRVTHWSQNGRTYTLAMLAPEAQWSTLDPLFNYVLLSIAPFGSAGGTSNSPRGETNKPVTAAAASSTSYAKWYKKGVGSFSYPSTWEVEPGLDQHVIVKIAGTDGSGRRGELQLTHHPAWDGLPLQQFADTVEKTYLKPQKNWAKLTESNVTFGSGTRREGLRRSGSMTVNGVPAMSHTTFWSENGKHYCLSVTTMGYSRQDADSLFSKAMQTLTMDDANTGE